MPFEGVISLPVLFGADKYQVTEIVDFLVVNIHSRFNVVLGRRTLCKIGAVMSQPHLCMKFPTLDGVGIVRVNQKMARNYYTLEYREVNDIDRQSEGIPRRNKRKAKKLPRQDPSENIRKEYDGRKESCLIDCEN